MEFLFRNFDPIILGFIFLTTSILTYRYTRAPKISLRVFCLFFTLFGAMAISLSMVGHLFEIGYKAIARLIEGTFVYNFRFYSLMFMGVVFLLIGLYMLRQVKALVSGSKEAKSNFIKAAVLVSVLSLPTFPISPIGILPTAASIISVSALVFAVKPVQKPNTEVGLV